MRGSDQAAGLLADGPGGALPPPPLLLRLEGLRGEGEAAELGGDEGVLDEEHLEDVPGRAGQQRQLGGQGAIFRQISRPGA